MSFFTEVILMMAVVIVGLGLPLGGIAFICWIAVMAYREGRDGSYKEAVIDGLFAAFLLSVTVIGIAAVGLFGQP